MTVSRSSISSTANVYAVARGISTRRSSLTALCIALSGEMAEASGLQRLDGDKGIGVLSGRPADSPEGTRLTISSRTAR